MRCNVLPFQEVRTLFLLLTIAVLGTIQDGLAEKKIVCYYTNWSIYRPGTAKFSPQNINPYLCTHLIYAFGGFTKDNALKPFDKYQDIEKGGYAKFTGLKTYNKNLKTMLAIGGWNEGSSRFSPMLADPARRKELVKNSIKFLRQNHFDGLDLDWEYPAFRDGGKPHDKNNYANFVQELYEEFERESKKTGRARLLLSMAMPAGIEYIDKGYDVPRLNEYLDFINLLSYDYHSAYEPAVNHHAPLYPLEEDNEYNYDSELTINYTINHLMKSGASSEKIILGIPTYGRSYTLFNEDATDLGSPADGPGIEGDDTREKGYLSYYEICEGITNSDDWEVIQPNPKAMGPYAFKGNQWVGYDDVDIVRLKARFINEKNLGGIMFWSIDNDDFRGKCHNRPYPLIEAGKETLLIEDTRNVAQKPKSSDSRKKLRGQGTPNNSIRRKVNSNVRRSTTSAPVTRKQVTTSRTKYRTIARTRFSEEEEDREVERRSYDPSSIEEKNESGNAVRSSDKNKRKRSRNRSNNRNRSSTGRRRKPIRNDENDENDRDSTTVGESLSNKLTTPEPPTTPDPGTDFKCEDEGFYPHPRECKKYFWCLDSGPGGLGLVVYQFTCPAGLVFNKAADSCDYPRNVVCPKAKTPQTTTRAPITAATSRTTYLHSTTQRTTTAKSDSEEEEEYYEDEEELEDLDDEEEEEEEEEEKVEFKITSTMKPLQYKTINRNKPSTASKTTSTTSKPEKEEEYKNNDPTDEEDPRVIKELINLIRKAGGIEELEKQLHLQEKGSSATSNNDPVTPATISRTLYERVLNRQASKIINSNVSGSSEKNNYKNGPGRAQFEGLDEIPEVKSLRRIQKPQYVTIERPKASTNAPQLEDEETDDDDELEDYNVNVASSEDETISNPSEISTSTQRVTPNYVNIRRNRFSTTTSKNENDVEEKTDDAEEETPIRRRRPNGSTKNQDKESEHVSKPFRTRTRYRNTESNKSTEESSVETDSEEKPIQGTRQTDHEINTATTKSRYINIQRFRSTTQKISVSDSDISEVDEITTETSTIKNKIDREEEVTMTSTTPPTFSTISSTTPSTSIQSTLSSVSVTPIYLSSSTSRSTSNEATTVKLDRVEDTSIANVLNDNNNLLSSTTTDSPVKLVEESATEILFTTAPASPSPASTSLLTTTRIVATVSQPRPFGFTRRRSGSLTPDVTTTPLAPSSDHSRSKVSITSRNSTRSSSFLVGRGRLRSRTDTTTRLSVNKRITEQDQLENPPTSEETFIKPRETTVNKSRPSNKRRGINRYISSTNSPINEDISKNTISRRRSRTTESPSTTIKTITESSGPRRRYRRPSIQSTTETTKSNELEDSPIVRITQGYTSRSKKFRSKSEINLEQDNNEKITNIRVFKQSPNINKELYGRTRTTSKRNYVDIEDINQRTSESPKNNEKISISFNVTAAATTTTTTIATTTIATTATTKEIEESTTESSLSTVQITDNDTTNIIDNDLDELSTPTVTEIDETNTSVQTGSEESDTIASTYITESTTDSNTVSTDSNVSYETSENPEEISTTENILMESISPFYKNTEIIQSETNIDTVDSTERKLTNQRRKKVILRRRPVTASINTSTTIQIEENNKYQVNRRRKVLKRVRLIDGKSSTASFESSSSQEEEQSTLRSTTSSEMTISKSDNTSDHVPTELKSEKLQESDNVTENISTFATEFPNVIDYTLNNSTSTDSNLETSTMTTESTKDDSSVSDLTTMQTIIIDGAITEALTSLITESTLSENEDLYSTVITTEPTITPPTTYTENTFDPEETRLSTENVTTSIQTITPSHHAFTRHIDESQIHSRSSPSETRYVRKKFIRKRPVLLSETTNSRYALISRPQNRVSSTTEKNDVDVNQLTKRRKSLFIRRRPVSSTTKTTEELDLDIEDPNETEDEGEQEDFINSDDVQDTTATAIITSASVENESLEFWNHYTTPAEKTVNQRSSPPPNRYKNTYLTTEPSFTTYPTFIREHEESEKDDSRIAGNINKPRYVTINRRLESRRSYKVPSSIKNLDNVQEEKIQDNERALSTKRWYPIDDSSPEETEENPNTKEAAKLRFSGYRQARARYRNYEEKLQKERENKERDTTSSYFEFSPSTLRSRYQTKRPITPIEIPVTETLIPAKKFDYAADAFHRKQQSLRTTTPQQLEVDTTGYQNEENSELQNLVDSDRTTTPSNKPLVTRLVTSIAESGTTERQKILIKTKYSSLTSTTRIPVQNVITRNDYPSTTPSLKKFIDSTNNNQAATTLDESINEIRPAIEASTLPIESEFVYRNNGRFTTESHESSTIPIESVFSNLIAGTKEH
ncbi:serine-rich adhesin for platelets isoform X1 [Vespa velutina]|uniref:serine-rich adhesin for platelets isoform X1 n=1 Tax=Vespa velutina TaxID=202808 RepID=UPI001FB3D2F4|nr:serine-rich adhesin for platelets isoform X1 [Vespa velutina]